MKKLLIALLGVAAFIGCEDDSDYIYPKAQRTVLIYMAAQNNLTNDMGNRYAEFDLQEIKEGIRNMDDNHLVVYVNKAKDSNKAKDDHLPYLLHYYKGTLYDSIPMDSTMLPCDPATLQTVMKHTVNYYPADDYGLVLWGHATGWLYRNDTIAYSVGARNRAYGGTNTNESAMGSGNKWMNIHTLAQMLKTQPHLKFILADCCNMMCAECAYELKDVCDYYIGSPAEIPGKGAPYELIVPALMERETFYRSILDHYAERYNNGVPLAVVKTSEMPNLAAATKTILQAIKAASMTTTTTFPTEALSGIYYLDRNLYDMNHFLMLYANRWGVSAEYQSWKQVFDQAIIYKKFARRWDTMGHVYFIDFDITEEYFGGMSMFVPQWKLQTTDNEYIKKFRWYYDAGYDTIGW